ncbi:MAG: hypothetical protein IJ925_03950 [Muribaculaceae bacterium]|nr:hypothetical protein [Muribaculaceae bacterium]
MKKLFLLFFATAAMVLVSCGGSSSEGSESSASDYSTQEQVQEMSTPVETPSATNADTAKAAVDGAENASTTSENATCSRCGGSGKVACSKCHGKGYTSKRTLADEGYWTQYYGCKKCGGSGHKSSEGYAGEHMKKGSGKMTCPDCGGSGK